MLQTGSKRRKDKVRLGRKNEPVGIVQKIKFDDTNKYSCFNEMYKNLSDFKIRTDHLILAKRSDLKLINKKK